MSFRRPTQQHPRSSPLKRRTLSRGSVASRRPVCQVTSHDLFGCKVLLQGRAAMRVISGTASRQRGREEQGQFSTLTCEGVRR